MNEFVNCTIVAIVIWAALDPTNYLIPPAMGPPIIAFGYGAVIWGFGTAGLALNTARDIGARLMVITFWGLPAVGGRYAIIAALTNIPATLLGACIYEFLLADSDRAIPASHMDVISTKISHGRLGAEQYDGDSDEKGKSSFIERSHA